MRARECACVRVWMGGVVVRVRACGRKGTQHTKLTRNVIVTNAEGDHSEWVRDAHARAWGGRGRALRLPKLREGKHILQLVDDRN